mmetsp:Transcript_151837/g.487241  ORF Transcript_151837/g.487241 Transcript_151837/m.487241 type:complete len:497 (-) Transcript_151837:238-1728(-)
MFVALGRIGRNAACVLICGRRSAPAVPWLCLRHRERRNHQQRPAAVRSVPSAAANGILNLVGQFLHPIDLPFQPPDLVGRLLLSCLLSGLAIRREGAPPDGGLHHAGPPAAAFASHRGYNFAQHILDLRRWLRRCFVRVSLAQCLDVHECGPVHLKHLLCHRGAGLHVGDVLLLCGDGPEQVRGLGLRALLHRLLLRRRLGLCRLVVAVDPSLPHVRLHIVEANALVFFLSLLPIGLDLVLRARHLHGKIVECGHHLHLRLLDILLEEQAGIAEAAIFGGMPQLHQLVELQIVFPLLDGLAELFVQGRHHLPLALCLQLPDHLHEPALPLLGVEGLDVEVRDIGDALRGVVVVGVGVPWRPLELRAVGRAFIITLFHSLALLLHLAPRLGLRSLVGRLVRPHARELRGEVASATLFFALGSRSGGGRLRGSADIGTAVGASCRASTALGSRQGISSWEIALPLHLAQVPGQMPQISRRLPDISCRLHLCEKVCGRT